MAALTDYLEGALIGHLFRGAAYTPPAGLYFALFTVSPTDAGGGTEVTGGSYARVNVAPGTTNWSAPSSGNGTTQNNNAITFAGPTANWGTIVAFGIFDAATGGNLLMYGALTASKAVNNGDAAPSFAAAAFQFQIDN